MNDAPRIKALLQECVVEVAQYLFPNGKRDGNHWCVGDVTGAPGKSFKVCIAGDKAGLWGDFAESGKHSRNPLNLWMHARNVDFKTALREAAQWLGQPLNGHDNDGSIFPTLDEAIANMEGRLAMRVTRRDSYPDRDGNEHFVVVRFDGENGKQFRPFHRNSSGWIAKDPPGKLPLFRLPELIARPGERIFHVEGEKCASDLATLGSLVTASAHGANSAHKSDWQPLAGREVVILPDNDAEGRAYAQTVAQILSRLSPPAAVRIVELPGLPSKGDCVDWLDARDSQTSEAITAELLALVKNAEVIRDARNGKSDSTELPEAAQAQPFPLHCLPPGCEAMARAVCETVRVLESLPGCCVLGILSAAVGAGLQVRSGANRVTRGNLYILPSAESGSGKSETFRHLAKPFLQFEAERWKTWKVEILPGLLAERDILESEIDNLKKQAGKADDAVERGEIRSQLEEKKAALEEIEIKLRAPVLTCEDITSQKLAELLAHNAEQLASLSADASEIVNVLLGRYNKLDRTDASVYLKAFTGDYCKVDRKNSEPVLLQSPCLSALWLTQPDKLESLLAERSLSDGGLIPRILTCHTHCDAREIVKDAPEIPASVENDYTNLVRTLIETYRLADEPFTIELTSEALDAMNAHYNAIVKRRRSDLRDVTIYAARWNEQAWRIAVCLHAGLHGAHAHEHTLELDTAKRAIELADWFAAQQLEILSASREKARREIWDEVLSLLADRPEGIRASDVYRARIVRTADEAHTLLAAMEAGGELSGRDEQPESGGHVTRIFTRANK
jgi:Protein of unknown function (DUF3987)